MAEYFIGVCVVFIWAGLPTKYGTSGRVAQVR